MVQGLYRSATTNHRGSYMERPSFCGSLTQCLNDIRVIGGLSEAGQHTNLASARLDIGIGLSREGVLGRRKGSAAGIYDWVGEYFDVGQQRVVRL